MNVESKILIYPYFLLIIFPALNEYPILLTVVKDQVEAHKWFYLFNKFPHIRAFWAWSVDKSLAYFTLY